MKKISLIAFATVALFIASCSDETVDPTVDVRDKFTGDWLCKETISGQAKTPFTITISKIGNGDSILIKNFNNLVLQKGPIAEVDGNSFVISFQYLPIVLNDSIIIDSTSIKGYGIYSSSGGEKINMDYVVDGDSITALCTRKP